MSLTAPPTHLPAPADRQPLLGQGARKRLLGTVGLLVVAALIALVIAAYDQAFSPAVTATVVADRAGLLMYNGADVTLNGLTVGRVTSITPVGGQAKLGISLNPAQVTHIPANVQAAISDATVFGPKYLNLMPPATPSTQQIHSGEVLEQATVPTEVNTVFGNLVSLLDSAQPTKLSATLGAISTGLQGHGKELGDFIAQLNTYLREFNPSLPAVSADFRAAPQVLRSYAGAAPALIATLGNLSVTSSTLASQQAQFDAFLLDLTGFAGHTRSFLADNESSLSGTLATLAPVTALAAEYSPEFPCLFGSLEQQKRLSKSSRFILHTTFLPGQQGYQYPRDLPEVHAASAPSCYGGPITPAEAAHYPHIDFNDGSTSYNSRSDSLSPGSPPLSQQLFGPEAQPPFGQAGKGH
jgi:phospholipid/cholesterol/gamma-HCH transport system substrate-binding protein